MVCLTVVCGLQALYSCSFCLERSFSTWYHLFGRGAFVIVPLVSDILKMAPADLEYYEVLGTNPTPFPQDGCNPTTNLYVRACRCVCVCCVLIGENNREAGDSDSEQVGSERARERVCEREGVCVCVCVSAFMVYIFLLNVLTCVGCWVSSIAS